MPRKSTLLEKLAVLKMNCKPNMLYRSTRIASILGLKIDNTRRYLRQMVNLGFVEAYKYGRYKYYRVLFGERILFGKRVKVLDSQRTESEVVA